MIHLNELLTKLGVNDNNVRQFGTLYFYSESCGLCSMSVDGLLAWLKGDGNSLPSTLLIENETIELKPDTPDITYLPVRLFADSSIPMSLVGTAKELCGKLFVEKDGEIVESSTGEILLRLLELTRGFIKSIVVGLATKRLFDDLCITSSLTPYANYLSLKNFVASRFCANEVLEALVKDTLTDERLEQYKQQYGTDRLNFKAALKALSPLMHHVTNQVEPVGLLIGTIVEPKVLYSTNAVVDGVKFHLMDLHSALTLDENADIGAFMRATDYLEFYWYHTLRLMVYAPCRVLEENIKLFETWASQGLERGQKIYWELALLLRGIYQKRTSN